MPDSTRRPSVDVVPFGSLPDGTAVELYALANGPITLEVLTYGGIITRLATPDRHGETASVVLGHRTLAPYLDNRDYFGAIVGRCANRIAGGRFALDGISYELATNDGPNHLHGGRRGFDQRTWSAEPFAAPGTVGLRLALVSPAGDEGYPGALTATVTYIVNADRTVVLDYEARTDAPTIVGLTQHTYFNLSGVAGATVLDHELTIAAAHYTPVNRSLIPTGVIARVDGTPFDWRAGARIGERLVHAHEQLDVAGGFDHNFVLAPPGPDPRWAATLHHPGSGRRLRVTTTEPGLQFYGGHMLGRPGSVFRRHAGLCLETQHFPDSPNHPGFPPVTLRPGDTYASTTRWDFSDG